jgi:hypothetical protein
MNTKAILKTCLLAAMLASFFVSNGITGTPAKSSCSGSDTCSDNGCNRSDGNGGNWCCVGGGGSPCGCYDTTSSQCP